MILKIAFVVLIFLLGIIDRVLALSIADNPFYIGIFIYIICVTLKYNKFITFLGFFYGLGLQAQDNMIGILSISFLILEYLNFNIAKKIIHTNKIIAFIDYLVFSTCIYIMTNFILSNYKLYFNLGFIWVFIILVLISFLGVFIKNER
jgi:hypothetical protein